jgi:hypothetical protein
LCEAGAGGATLAGKSGEVMHRAQIGRHGADVLWHQMVQAAVDRFAHRPRSGAVAVGVADRKIGDEIVVAPATDAGRLVRCDVVGAPARGDGTGKFLAVVQRKRQVSRRVAFAAMGQRPEIGREFYRHCVAITVEADAAQEAIDRLRSEPQGVVRMSCPSSLIYF